MSVTSRDPPPAPCQRLFAVARVDHVVSFLSQRLDDEFADRGVVLDDKYSHRQLLDTLKSDTNLRTAEPLSGFCENGDDPASTPEVWRSLGTYPHFPDFPLCDQVCLPQEVDDGEHSSQARPVQYYTARYRP
jgi:hypothetical protein